MAWAESEERRTMSALFARIIVCIACLAALCLAPSRAPAQDNDDKEPISVTKKDIGAVSVSTEDAWYKIELSGKHIGYYTIKYLYTGNSVVISENAEIRVPEIRATQKSETSAAIETGSGRPVREFIKYEKKIGNSRVKIAKTIYFDWKNSAITIVLGQETNTKNRVIRIPPGALHRQEMFFFLLNKANLKPGTEYRFLVFDNLIEKFVTLSAKIIMESQKDVFQISLSPAYAYTQAYPDSMVWVGPRSSAHPNGALFREETLAPGISSGSNSVKTLKTTKDKALPSFMPKTTPPKPKGK